MKDPWRGDDLPATETTPDDEDSLATLPLWHLACPGGRVTVRSREASDEFGGLLSLAQLVRGAFGGTQFGDSEPRIEAVLPGEPMHTPPTAGLRLSASRNTRVVVVYAVNLLSTAQPAARQQQGLRLLFDAVRTAARHRADLARSLGVSVVLK